jgi:hypothetical protein
MGHRLTTALSHPPLGCDAWRLSDVNEIEMWDCAPSIDSPRTFADDAKRVAVTVESRTEVWGAATQSLPMIRRARREPRSAAKTPRKEQPRQSKRCSLKRWESGKPFFDCAIKPMCGRD